MIGGAAGSLAFTCIFYNLTSRAGTSGTLFRDSIFGQGAL
jgi:hypothetical protein